MDTNCQLEALMAARPEVAIVMPTLDLVEATKTAYQARKLAGISTAIIVVWDYRMRGGIKPANAGFQAALDLEAPFICYLNDDCQITQQDWLCKLVEALRHDESYGIATPGGLPESELKDGVGFRIKNPRAWFCAVIKRELLLEIGGFDRELIHYAGDSLFTSLAYNRGWKKVWVRDVYLEHHTTGGHGRWARHDSEVRERKKNG